MLKDIRLQAEWDPNKLVAMPWEKAKKLGWSRRDNELYNINLDMSEEELDARINEGHKRVFIGKVGNFCPIQAGYGGAEMVCLNEQGKYNAVYVKEHHMEDKIDYDYLENMCRSAIDDISKYDASFFD